MTGAPNRAEPPTPARANAERDAEHAALVLFDVDGTLIDARGAGRRALIDAGRALFGPAFTTDGVHFAGSIDALIIREALVASGLEPTARESRTTRGRHSDGPPSSG